MSTASGRKLIVKASGGKIAIYDPEKGLDTILVAEAAEKRFARARDATKLFKAIEAKLTEQARYVVWRDSVTDHGGDRKSKSRSQHRDLDLPGADPGHKIAHRWRKRLCSKTGDGTAIDDAKLGREIEEAQQHALRVCEHTDAYAKAFFTGEFEQFTPAEYIGPVREVLGEIDLDPASCKQAQRTVKAARYFTAETDGLKQEWHGRVFLNPPYHRALLPLFVDKLITELAAGRTSAAIMLVNIAGDTNWFHRAHAACSAFCFTHGRINFVKPSGEEVEPTQGQCFFYFGDDVVAFERAFRHVGLGSVPTWSFVEREPAEIAPPELDEDAA